ncbi:TetR/AcrR family transcriptional regulator [Corallococcus interemptor]|uniref:TetR/AcrR family transcriptional regulator n=1 Tax=Corallococcus interemptor TaxID=2316720 RepID=A0A3A8QJ15_9BACT|nr:TetR/AcrR family transcriptional regulator [Corallococcus sp. AB050B]RKH68696.1 TetR/AcrR family transcriptional regulator [Corallococcus interemptor]
MGGILRDPKKAPPSRGGVERQVRADARRNLDALLEAAKEAFATSGVDAPAREIADKAGVGVGTLYRHFPQRADLIVAVVRNEVDACAEAASAIAAEFDPGEALARWVQRYVGLLGTKRGLAAALHSGDPAYKSLPDYFLERVQPALQALLDAAALSGEIRADVDATELLFAIARLCAPDPHDGGPEPARRMAALLVDGLRYGAQSKPPSPSKKRR